MIAFIERDGVSLIDLGMALATAFSVIGASIGFKLSWGPIYWGIISAFIGFILGLGIKIFMFKVIRKNQRLLARQTFRKSYSLLIVMLRTPKRLNKLCGKTLP